VISVIVSNFNGLRFLPKLLESLRAQRGVALEIIIVDRESRDGSLAFLAAQPDVRVITEPPQSGLVSGYHAGTKVAQGDLFFFANEDLWLDPDCLRRLAERIDLAAKTGIADPWEWTYDGVRMHHAGVRFRSAAWDFNSPWPRARFDFLAPLGAGERIPFPCAGAVLIHRACYADLGGWDTSFFLDFEDMDLGIRAWQRGWTGVTVPEARVFHAVGASDTQSLATKRDTVSRRRYLSNRSSLAVMALKTFSLSALPVTALAWWSGALNNARRGRWRRFGLDFLAAREVLRRAPAAWQFRRANSAYNHYHPGERFFTAPEFTARPGAGG
jgi:GT2 family glycosyltransferase